MPNDKINTMQEDEKLVFEEEFGGEPTTADEHNKVYISDVNKEIVDEMNEAIKETPEYKLGKKVFGGDTGIDADYYDENSEKYISEPVEVLYKKDILKLIDKVEDLEQMIYNQGAKNRDNYKLINDRITEAFDIIKILEKEK
tara:strand:+ start:183 stop:608 length:426 start_codon:yes stop_codon:yes gene_type:complete